MARADRRRTKRPKPAPGIRASGGAGAVEQTLFFNKLRRSAKWVFAFLAIVFAASFVFFGVGSDVPGGVADILQGRSSSSGPSVDDAEERLAENPRDPQALLDMSTALQSEGRPLDAIPFLERYSRVRPRDADALRQLAALHVQRAGNLRNEIQIAQIRAAELAPGAGFTPPAGSPFAQAFGNPPILNAVTQSAQSGLSDELDQLGAEYRQAATVYERIAVLEPENATLQLQLADAALNSQDTVTALAAYRRFVELAPDDSRTPLVKQEIERLEASGQVTGG